MEVLGRNGIDTTGLRDDVSVSNSEAGSAGAQDRDLADAVSELAQKAIAARASVEQLALKTVGENALTSSASARVRDLEEKLTRAVTEAQEMRAHRSKAEKRVEKLKEASVSAKEEIAALTNTVASLHQKVLELDARLLQQQSLTVNAKEEAAAALAAPAQIVSSENDSLKEENIELMKELREAKAQAANFKLQLDRLQLQMARLYPAVRSDSYASPLLCSDSDDYIPDSSSSAVQFEACSGGTSELGASHQEKQAARSFGTDITVSAVSEQNVDKKHNGDARAPTGPVKTRRQESPMKPLVAISCQQDGGAGGRQSEVAEAAMAGMAAKRSRTRTKATTTSSVPVAADSHVDSAVAESEGCTQS